jgi:hypothetical protein
MTEQLPADKIEAAKAVTRAFKGFDKDFVCKGTAGAGGQYCQHYEVGGTYRVEGDLALCSNGFHACASPLDVLTYYPAATSRYAIVDLIGDVAKSQEANADSKLCAQEIRILREITYFELWQAHREWFNGTVKEAQSSGDSGHAQSSGDSGHAQSSGDSGHAQSSGDRGHAQSSGDRGHAQSSGDSGHAQSSGDSGHAQSSGDSGHAQSSGYRGHAQSSGDSGHAQSSGDSGHAQSSGANSIAVAIGRWGRAKAAAGNWIVLAHYDDDWKLISVKTARCGDGGELKPDTWYQLDANGEFAVASEPEAV